MWGVCVCFLFVFCGVKGKPPVWRLLKTVLSHIRTPVLVSFLCEGKYGEVYAAEKEMDGMSQRPWLLPTSEKETKIHASASTTVYMLCQSYIDHAKLLHHGIYIYMYTYILCIYVYIYIYIYIMYIYIYSCTDRKNRRNPQVHKPRYADVCE